MAVDWERSVVGLLRPQPPSTINTHVMSPSLTGVAGHLRARCGDCLLEERLGGDRAQAYAQSRGHAPYGADGGKARAPFRRSPEGCGGGAVPGRYVGVVDRG